MSVAWSLDTKRRINIFGKKRGEIAQRIGRTASPRPRWLRCTAGCPACGWCIACALGQGGLRKNNEQRRKKPRASPIQSFLCCLCLQKLAPVGRLIPAYTYSVYRKKCRQRKSLSAIGRGYPRCFHIVGYTGSSDRGGGQNRWWGTRSRRFAAPRNPACRESGCPWPAPACRA